MGWFEETMRLGLDEVIYLVEMRQDGFHASGSTRLEISRAMIDDNFLYPRLSE